MKKRPFVFIAEDNKSDILFLTRVFEKTLQEYDVVFSESVEESIKIFRKCIEQNTLPNLVFLDIRLCDGSGFDILKFIKSSEQLRELPVIVMSSSDRKQDTEEAMSLGANQYIEKIRGYTKLKEKLPSIVNLWAIKQ